MDTGTDEAIVDKQALFGGILRTAVSGGGIVFLANWVARNPRRKMRVELCYPSDNAVSAWSLTLFECDGGNTLDYTGESLESVIAQAVVAIGKGR